MADRVLLTGISGFLGGHVALALLEKGYQVRGSVRNLARADAVRQMLARAGGDVSGLEFVALDLLDDKGWADAVRDCRYLQHTASPFVIEQPKDRDVLIRPALEGTRRDLAAAFASTVERVVLTSSIAAIAYGHPAQAERFTEADWTLIGAPGVTAYAESKTRAEQEAWAMAERAGRRADLSVINPGAILGPLLDDDPGTSATLVQRILLGRDPAAPKMSFSFVDVRDVAALHVLAMTSPAAAGQRLIAAESEKSFMDIIRTLRVAVPAYAGKMPRMEAPNWLLRLLALFDAQIRDNIGELVKPRRVDAGKARALLGRPFIRAEDAAIATARSLIAAKLV